MTKAIFAAGCFWGIEEHFLSLQGVTDCKVGYIGGHTDHPTYKQVCGGDTGHAEAVDITFDENIISYQDLLKEFWQCHDPTQINRQGVDIGSQYRSAIFTLDEQQQKQAEQAKNAAQKKFSKPIATEITPAAPFYLAEDYHQRYIRKRRGSL